ncbi:GTP pyrophosphokinase family protein [Cellulomonas sp. KRMCY2]|uniref:GTP pyrophosphokinase n=1 Tax=Cellulomonas sp. KRMCY2 TaxID=1304865 RepID=UPI0018CC2A94|nr:RelA/SpoT domain-containing protein [Cellulomonas sp. KRMCY2]
MSEPRPGDIEAVVARYVSEHATYEKIAQLVGSEVQGLLDAGAMKCRIDHRAKDVRSFHKKIVDKAYSDPWEQITDKAGVRVIVEAPRDVDDACRIIASGLGERVIRCEDKRHIGSPDRLGYSGVHLQVSLVLDGAVRECEIQMRTASQDLWSVMSHRWLYKPVVELPDEMQHAAYRLGALVEIFDEEVQRLADREREARADPVQQLIAIAESAYLTVAHSPSDRSVSRWFVEPLLPAFTDEELSQYGDLMDAFVLSERETLRILFAEYGPHGALAYLPQFLLFGQAESVLLLERLSSHPRRLLSCWRDAGLPMPYLQALADAAAIDLPD